MTLTDAERKALKQAIAAKRSERLNAVLRSTTRPAEMTPDLARETMGADPWDTRAAPGHSQDDALNRNALVTPR